MNKTKDWRKYIDEQDAKIIFLNSLKTTTKNPNKEGLKILRSITDNHVICYPQSLKNDSQKFKHLKNNYNKNNITEKIFIEFADVLIIKKTLIKKTIKEKIASEIKW